MIRFVFVVALFAALVYLFVRFLENRGTGKPTWGPAVRRERPVKRQVAPDDDEQFLRDLDRKHREGTEET